MDGRDAQELDAGIVGAQQEGIGILKVAMMSFIIWSCDVGVWYIVSRVLWLSVRVFREGASGVRTQSSQSGILRVVSVIFV